MDTEEKPECKFGSKCYRKNPKHFETYSHPKASTVGKKGSRLSEKTGKPQKKRKNCTVDKKKTETQNKRMKTANCFKTNNSINDSTETNNEGNNESVQSTSWVYIKTESTESKPKSSTIDLHNKSVKEIIKLLFLVDMPNDFYSFFDFHKMNSELFKCSNLKLVGPFDVLSGKVKQSGDPDSFLCHWRFYYDPPEFQTVLVGDSNYHIGYWRDEPKAPPVFLVSNDPNKNCIINIESENLFGTVHNYLNDLIKVCSPFKKMEISKLQKALSDWANKNKFTLERRTNRMKERERKVVSKTFHNAGIVVPVDPKTELGYRPLIEKEANLKRICNLIMKADSESERESLWENLQPLITAANIANDECDFGNSLELGIDLFCMGSPVFHETVEHLLTTAYSLLDRSEFERIVRAHLKSRRKTDLSVID